MKPLNQVEKDRLTAYKELFKHIGEFSQNIEFLRRCVASLDAPTINRVVGSATQIANAKAKLLSYIDLLEREHL